MLTTTDQDITSINAPGTFEAPEKIQLPLSRVSSRQSQNPPTRWISFNPSTWSSLPRGLIFKVLLFCAQEIRIEPQFFCNITCIYADDNHDLRTLLEGSTAWTKAFHNLLQDHGGNWLPVRSSITVEKSNFGLSGIIDTRWDKMLSSRLEFPTIKHKMMDDVIRRLPNL